MNIARRSLILFAAAAITSGAAVSVSPVQAQQTCAYTAYTVTSGEVNWGIKRSWRNYIKRIALGNWETAGAVTERDSAFVFPVAAANSQVRIDSTGKVTAAHIKTQDSTITFDGGWHGFTSTFKNFVFGGENGTLKAASSGSLSAGGTTTEVPTSIFAGGEVEWKRDGNKLVGALNNTNYIANPNTNGSTVAGGDVFFNGQYKTGQEMDPITITLQVESACVDAQPDEIEPLVNQGDDVNTKHTNPLGSSNSSGSSRGTLLAALVALPLFGGIVAWILNLIPGLPSFNQVFPRL